MQPAVKTYDGVAFLARGDTIIVVYRSPARLQRSKWLYDLADRAAAQNPGGIMTLMVILPTADPPDAATRAENSVRLRKLAPAMRRFVTVAIGDDFRVSVVRTVMRALSVLQGKSKVHFVANTAEDGVSRLLEVASPTTPGRVQLMLDLKAMYQALGCAGEAANPTAPH